jgi:quercetin dioxygenase-like cupin family protein
MKILESVARSSERGRPAWFTGTVLLDDRLRKAAVQPAHPFVTFEPGARTPLGISHALEQVLNVLSGLGRVAREGGPTGRLALATRFWIEPGERQWHGSAPGRVFVHQAVQEAMPWFEHVAEDQYRETSELFSKEDGR